MLLQVDPTYKDVNKEKNNQKNIFRLDGLKPNKVLMCCPWSQDYCKRFCFAINAISSEIWTFGKNDAIKYFDYWNTKWQIHPNNDTCETITLAITLRVWSGGVCSVYKMSWSSVCFTICFLCICSVVRIMRMQWWKYDVKSMKFMKTW